MKKVQAVSVWKEKTSRERWSGFPTLGPRLTVYTGQHPIILELWKAGADLLLLWVGLQCPDTCSTSWVTWIANQSGQFGELVPVHSADPGSAVEPEFETKGGRFRRAREHCLSLKPSLLMWLQGRELLVCNQAGQFPLCAGDLKADPEQNPPWLSTESLPVVNDRCDGEKARGKGAWILLVYLPSFSCREERNKIHPERPKP